MCFSSDASSTRMISSRSWAGDLLIMEWRERRRVDQASLWKTITMLVVGRDPG